MSEFVYILTNPAIPNLINICWTKKDIVRQIREISSHPGVPAPFECFYCCEVEDGMGNQAEAEIHLKFKDLHFNPTSSFFRIDPEIIKIVIEKKWAKGDATPNGDTLAEPQQPYTHSRSHTKAPVTTFSMLNIPIGSELTFDKDSTKIARVVGDRKVEYRGRIDYLSTITQYIYNEEGMELGRNWGTYRGTNHWSFEGENLTDRRHRLDSSSGLVNTTTDKIVKKGIATNTNSNPGLSTFYTTDGCNELEHTKPIGGSKINGNPVRILGWNNIMHEVMGIVTKYERDVTRFKQMFGASHFKEGRIPGWMYIKDLNLSIRGKSAPAVGRILKQGGLNVPYTIDIKYEWRRTTQFGKMGEQGEFKVNC